MCAASQGPGVATKTQRSQNQRADTLLKYTNCAAFFAVALGLCRHAQAFSSPSELGPLFFAIRRLLIAVVENRL